MFLHVTCSGFNVETVPYAKHELVMWDVGGRNAVSGCSHTVVLL